MKQIFEIETEQPLTEAQCFDAIHNGYGLNCQIRLIQTASSSKEKEPSAENLLRYLNDNMVNPHDENNCVEYFEPILNKMGIIFSGTKFGWIINESNTAPQPDEQGNAFAKEPSAEDTIKYKLSDLFECPKCHETNAECRCLRGKCDICGKPLGKITYTFCDECWESEPQEGQNGSDDKCLHECPECNCRCNCDSQPCSCCNEPQQAVSRENRHTGKLYREVDVKDRMPQKCNNATFSEWVTCYSYETLIGECMYDFENKCWQTHDNSLHSPVTHWLEPIEGKVKAEAVKLPKEDKPELGSENQETYEAFANGFNRCLEIIKKLNPSLTFITE